MTMALRRPAPRTAPTRPSDFAASARSSARISSPTRAAFCGSCSSTMTRSASVPTAHASGLPPHVLPCSPGRMVSITASSASTAETGYSPPPSALPRHTMSGRTPAASQRSSVPVRPRPVCTSSATISTLCCLHSAAAAGR